MFRKAVYGGITWKYHLPLKFDDEAVCKNFDGFQRVPDNGLFCFLHDSVPQEFPGDIERCDDSEMTHPLVHIGVFGERCGLSE